MEDCTPPPSTPRRRRGPRIRGAPAWTPSADARLLAIAAREPGGRKRALCAAAAELGRSEGACSQRLLRLGWSARRGAALTEAPPPAGTPPSAGARTPRAGRPCLACRRRFAAEAGMFVCDECKARERWRLGPALPA